MKIQIDPHTLERAEERGANEAEIRDVIETGSPIEAKYGRLGKAKVTVHSLSCHCEECSDEAISARGG